jgi:SAM-dependent methyltransferase
VPNTYSATWFELFMRPIQPVQTGAESTFVTRHLPLPSYRSVLDLCCGWGRHAQELAQMGYHVTGLDRDPAVIAEASRRTAGVSYRVHDMRALDTLPESYDAIINLWQSFGYFDEETNADVLRQMARKLTAHGRVILDIYHRAFFEQHQGTQVFERDGVHVTERKRMTGSRLTVDLVYGDGHGTDTFEWQLYTPDAIVALADQCGLACLVACSRFDEERPPSSEYPRMQFVLERTHKPGA